MRLLNSLQMSWPGRLTGGFERLADGGAAEMVDAMECQAVRGERQPRLKDKLMFGH